MAKRRHWVQRLLGGQKDPISWVRSMIAGSLYRISDLRGDSSISDIKTQIDTMRALTRDSQISTALSFYATDATTTDTQGRIIWATSKDESHKDVADIVNELFNRWNINTYARDHILELATIGNLYIPTTNLYVENEYEFPRRSVSLDSNTIANPQFDIVPSYKIPPEDIIHIYQQGKPMGYIMNPEDNMVEYALHPEESIIHFSLGGLLGEYTISTRDEHGLEDIYDIKFATPMLSQAVQPTQTLNLLEDALILSSLIRTVKFINVECGNAEEEEVQSILQSIKDAIEQQMSLNTASGDVQSFVNPQSPNNLIYLPKIKGQDAISVTDLNMADANEQDSKLLDYYQNKKLSVLGIPKEALNFSSNEGLGGAGTVLSQRSALYANALERLKTSYMAGWRDAINTYFRARGLSGLCDQFELHMTEIVTTQSTVTFEKRDAALSQASQVVQLLKDCGVTDAENYKSALTEILSEVLPSTSGEVNGWNVDVTEGGEDEI